ncbi:hypothetical protein HNO92_001407 [Chromobacterium alkanivorans]|uniref:hypothetical protein n=1 Tax=Chromobacterium alkanivorans TaxID=1071719 RepID=UPI0021681A8B|nr:hypothetical protein [Chromobacterium alkanivorans]MCS3804693.1 hypothetical protein [Chromobacterium alkanivorans]MCS3819033.1 hypothetical protein [Chromobacterium alkanivorans]MCS3873110.1 hypothetical protein [Chromobacterium alkanivorans]
MGIYCRGKACIRHRETGKIHEIESGELDWEVVGGDERDMGLETHYQAFVDHPELGTLTWDLWEYPEGIENCQNTDVGRHEAVDDFNFGLEHEEPEPDEWFDYSVPDNPFTIFLNSYNHTGDILADHGKDHGGFLLNRMVFSHQVTALEAYLGDTLINEVMGDVAAMQRLIKQDEELMKEKFTLVEISKEPTLVERIVRERLRSVLYHNLAKVNALYNIALGIQILNETKDKESLFKAVSLRHDCVHRNGFDKDGNELQVFTRKFVQDTADLIRNFVESIDRAVRTRPVEKS